MRRLLSRLSLGPKTSFQVLSDLHLEVGQQYNSFDIPRAAPYLILAGDIGRLIDYDAYLHFLTKQIEVFDLVFLVLGNHEFYKMSHQRGLEQAAKLGQEPCLDKRLILLHRRRYDLEALPITVLGCSLWSAIAEQDGQMIASKVSDFTQINGWSLESHNEEHQTDARWLREQVYQIQTDQNSPGRDSDHRTVLVVTHHAPTLDRTSSPKNTGSALGSAFATEMIDGENWPSVKAWVFGHTHFSTDYVKRGTRIFANQRGYVLPSGVSLGGEQSIFDVRKVMRL